MWNVFCFVIVCNVEDEIQCINTCVPGQHGLLELQDLAGSVGSTNTSALNDDFAELPVSCSTSLAPVLGHFSGPSQPPVSQPPVNSQHSRVAAGPMNSVSVPKPTPLVQSNVGIPIGPGPDHGAQRSNLFPQQQNQPISIVPQDKPLSLQRTHDPTSEQFQASVRSQGSQGSQGSGTDREFLSSQIAELNKQHEEAQKRLQSLMFRQQVIKEATEGQAMPNNQQQQQQNVNQNQQRQQVVDNQQRLQQQQLQYEQQQKLIEMVMQQQQKIQMQQMEKQQQKLQQKPQMQNQQQMQQQQQQQQQQMQQNMHRQQQPQQQQMQQQQQQQQQMQLQQRHLQQQMQQQQQEMLQQRQQQELLQQRQQQQEGGVRGHGGMVRPNIPGESGDGDVRASAEYPGYRPLHKVSVSKTGRFKA